MCPSFPDWKMTEGRGPMGPCTERCQSVPAIIGKRTRIAPRRGPAADNPAWRGAGRGVEGGGGAGRHCIRRGLGAIVLKAHLPCGFGGGGDGNATPTRCTSCASAALDGLCRALPSCAASAGGVLVVLHPRFH